MLKLKVIEENDQELFEVLKSDQKALQKGDLLSESALAFYGYWELEYHEDDIANAYTYKESCKRMWFSIDEEEE